MSLFHEEIKCWLYDRWTKCKIWLRWNIEKVKYLMRWRHLIDAILSLSRWEEKLLIIPPIYSEVEFRKWYWSEISKSSNFDWNNLNKAILLAFWWEEKLSILGTDFSCPDLLQNSLSHKWSSLSMSLVFLTQ